ncbi:MAG: SDR family oxidoreductase [Rhodoferax sp.]|nr:SDR family oxidoreductase [Rhodoferax sp.]MCW5631010.1 SDR family oxidoreductase [Rhodoferax sp.]
MPAAAPARVVLVTGSAKRLGREIALALARDGWQVAVHYRDSVEDAHRTTAQCAQLSGKSESFRANLANETAVRRLLPAVIQHFGHVDAVVNSASTFEHDTAQSFGFAAMEKHMRSNAGAAILLAQALHAHIGERRAALAAAEPPPERAEPQAEGAAAAPSDRPAGTDPDDGHDTPPPAPVPPLMGAVINLLDQKLWNQNPDFLSYTLSKAALEAANTMLAMALAPLVRVVGVAPGLTLTSNLLSDDAFRERHKMALLDQSSTPADVAATVRFALENRSLTGTSLLVDGGQHLMRFDRDFSLM